MFKRKEHVAMSSTRTIPQKYKGMGTKDSLQQFMASCTANKSPSSKACAILVTWLVSQQFSLFPYLDVLSELKKSIRASYILTLAGSGSPMFAPTHCGSHRARRLWASSLDFLDDAALRLAAEDSERMLARVVPKTGSFILVLLVCYLFDSFDGLLFSFL